MTVPPAAPARLLGAAEVRRLAERLGVRPAKRRGQNFVVDPNTIRRIARAADLRAGDVVLEIGPGLGSLTLALVAAGRVTAVEVDPALAAALPRTVAELAPDRAGLLTVVEADALTIEALPGPPPTALVSNLPYNVAVPVLLHLLRTQPSIEHGLVLVQQEVADRLAAEPGSAAYGAPSVKLAWYATARSAGPVPRGVFWPVPNVDSGLVSLVRRPPPPSRAGRERVFAVVDAAFAQRRKMLRSSLRRLLDPADADSLEDRLRSAGVEPTDRGERLGLAQFAAVADALG